MIQVKKKKPPYGIMIGFGLSAVTIALIMGGINQAKNSISGGAKDRLYEAVKNTAVHAYALEGMYPVSIEHMETNYGLRYDKERFFIEYQVVANNILPDIFIIDNEGEVNNNEAQ